VVGKEIRFYQYIEQNATERVLGRVGQFQGGRRGEACWSGWADTTRGEKKSFVGAQGSRVGKKTIRGNEEDANQGTVAIDLTPRQKFEGKARSKGKPIEEYGHKKRAAKLAGNSSNGSHKDKSGGTALKRSVWIQ